MQLFKQSIRTALFTLFLVANPAYFVACAPEPDYEYDEADMKSVLDDVNAAEWSAEGYAFQFHLEQGTGAVAALSPQGSSFIQSAHACGNRTFVASASACTDSSSMSVSGSISVFHINEDASLRHLADYDVRGELNVEGLTMDYLRLAVSNDQISIDIGTDSNSDDLVFSFVRISDPERDIEMEYNKNAP